MLDRLVGMFSGRKAPPLEEAGRGVVASSRGNEAFARLNAVAPLAIHVDGACAGKPVERTDRDAVGERKTMVCREAVLGRDQRVSGYGFSLRSEVNRRVRASSAHIQRLYDEVLVRNLQSMDVQRLLEHRLAFVALAASSLDKPLVEVLPPAGIVYVIGQDPQFATDAQALRDGLARLKSLGYQVGLQGVDIDRPGMPPCVELADFLSLDIGGSSIPGIADQMRLAARLAPKIRFLATNLRTLEEFGVCAKLPFSHFQGPFITHREKWEAPRMDAGRIKVLELLNKVRGFAEVAELAALFKQAPALSFKLLRYANSPGVGLTHKVGTLEQALMVLGRLKLYRWLTLLLFTSGETRELDLALLENALVRARLAELAGRERLPPEERDELFVTGVFSLLDVLMDTPMEAVLKQVSLPAAVQEALLNRAGKYAPYLELAIACEQSDGAGMEALSESVGLQAGQVNGLHIDALLWAQQVKE